MDMNFNGIERRRFPRVNFACRVRIANAPASLELTTENIGPGGIRVTLYRQMDRGIPVQMELYPAPDKKIECSGQISWVIEKPKEIDNQVETFDTGIQFTTISDEDRHYIYNLVEQICAVKDKEASTNGEEGSRKIIITAADLRPKQGEKSA